MEGAHLLEIYAAGPGRTVHLRLCPTVRFASFALSRPGYVSFVLGFCFEPHVKMVPLDHKMVRGDTFAFTPH